MKTFKSSVLIIVGNVLYGIIGSVVVAVLLSFFLMPWLSIVIGAIVGLVIVYFAVVGDNVKLTVDDETLTVYKGSRVKYNFDRSAVTMSAHIKNVDGDSDCKLTVTNVTGEETHIDCSMLGLNRFYLLLDALGVFKPEPVAVKTRLIVKAK